MRKRADQFAIPLVEQKTVEESVAQIESFREILRSVKITPPHPQFGWYPYDTMSNWWLQSKLIISDFSRLQQALRHRPVLDVGCGDGEMAFFLSFLGCQVTAVDLPSSNFNWMHGVRSLNTRLDCDVKILEMDLDGEAPFVLPDDDYGLVLFLGILYHLKNPFSILEKLARRCRYCMLSTRIAELTPKGMPMQGESLAYLLDSNEANNDPTNFWIFSETALIRLLRRSGWEIRASLKHGCLGGSNPSSNDADERMFLFLRSKVRSARADVKLSMGWWPIEEGGWCWVDKQFQIDIQLAENDGAPEFELRFIVHNPMPQKSAVSISCRANGIELGTMSELAAGEHVYRAELPDAINRGKKISLEFTVAHELDFPGESRDLGVIIPCRADRTGTGSPISFWIA